ncbi:hypothetical protein EBS80_02855 [bacterium]|nr:hypothetical protein [bacterium]
MKPVSTIDRWLLAAVALVAFLGCLVMLRVSGMYVSPDEGANAFFAHRFKQTGMLSAFEPLNVSLGDAIHPRSVVSVAGRLVPGSFIGLPVMYGSIAALLGEWSIPFWTPALAALAVCAWFGIVRKLFDREIALLSAILLAIHPAWWYYSARSLMHNVPFVALLIFSAYFLVVRPSSGRRHASLDFVASGACLGLALFVRTNEAVWIVPAVTALFLAFRAGVSRRQVAWFVASVAIALLPMFALNQATYGSPFTFGYNVGGNVAGLEDVASAVSADAPTILTYLSAPFRALFPFGLSWKDTARNVAYYGVSLFWWMSLLTLIGLPFAVPNRSVPSDVRPRRRAFALLALGVTLYLGWVYGSWTFFDNPDPRQVTIGNSHVRYWLPVFVLSTPFAALAVRWISRHAFTDFARRTFAVVLVVLCLVLSVRVAFFSPEDGILAASDGLAGSREVRDAVLGLTERDAVIVVDRGDKLFFPYRRVLYPLRSDATYELMPRIVLRAPLYYYGITFPETDLSYLNDEKLAGLGLKIEAVQAFDIETLYRITKR